MTSRPSMPQGRSLLVAAVLAAALPRPSARAGGSVAYKFENYREEDGRITVETQSGSVDEDAGAATHLHVTGTLDAITGATPTGQPAAVGSDQVGLSQLHERRKAWSGDASHQFDRVNLDVGFSDSRESDYVSRGWSVNTLTDFNQKNTTVRLGVAGTDDRVEVFFEPAYLSKYTNDVIAGVTQIIDPVTVATFNLSWGRATGYLSEQHKIVERTLQLLPGVFLPEAFAENRPDERNKGSAFASVNRAFTGAGGALEASERYYHDTFGVTAWTSEAAWIQHLGARWMLELSVRWTRQSAARFYYYNLDDTAIVPVRVPTGGGALYSSDFRLSAMDTLMAGAKLVWTARDWLRLDVSWSQYDLHGRDGVTPDSAYSRAGISTVGARISW